jgi:hypothetical protein
MRIDVSMARFRQRFESLARTALAYTRNVNQRFHSRNRRREFNPEGADFLAADWDTLVILDGCRYDTFREHADLPGTLSSRESRGSMTVEFLRGNLAGRTLHDTVYVTANGQFYNYGSEIDASFHHVENVWQYDEAWSDEHHTVLPETTTAYALRAAERFPDKRLVVHYVQPHYPFIDSSIDIDDAFDPDTPDFWRRIYDGDLSYSPNLLREAYVANLERALPHVQDLLAGLDGKTVVTSDHGNMLGDRAFPVPVQEWGHPPKLWVSELTRVPWLEYVDPPRRNVVAEPPVRDSLSLHGGSDTGDRVDDEQLADHLRHLGYKQ